MKKTIIGILAALFTVSLLTVTAFADNEKGVVTADVLNVRSQPQIADNVVRFEPYNVVRNLRLTSHIENICRNNTLFIIRKSGYSQ